MPYAAGPATVSGNDFGAASGREIARMTGACVWSWASGKRPSMFKKVLVGLGSRLLASRAGALAGGPKMAPSSKKCGDSSPSRRPVMALVQNVARPRWGPAYPS